MTKDRNAVDELLLVALEQGNAENVAKSIAKGANPNLRVDGIPVLQYAVISQRNEMAKQLLAGGADANAATKAGMTALMWAGMLGRGEQQNELIRMLLDSHADLNAVDDIGRTAVDIAVQFLNTDGVKSLVEAGATPSRALSRRAERMLASPETRSR
jgi:ankyrin repeat protein